MIARWHRQEWQTEWRGTSERFPSPRWVWPQGQTLWRVTLDSRPPQRIAADVDQYGWSADGQAIFYTTMNFAPTGDGLLAQTLYWAGLDGRDPEAVLRLPGGRAWPDIRPDGIYFVANGTLLRHDGQQLAAGDSLPLPAAANEHENLSNHYLVRHNPAGDRLAYSCQHRREEGQYDVRDLCLLDKDGENWTHIPLAAAQMELSWRPDGEQLAVVQWAYHHDPYVWTVENGESVLLAQVGERPRAAVVVTIVARDGRVLQTIPISDEGGALPAQWLADGRHLLLQLHIWGGRRIILVGTEKGTAADLSRPRWDAEFSLHPDGRQLLLSNGRGLFWLTEIRNID